MIQALSPVLGCRKVAENIFVLSCTSPDIAQAVQAGQFVNIWVEQTTDPLLRRPFSVYNTEGGTLEIIYNVIGKGTSALSRKMPGEMINVLGPLGTPFGIDDPGFSTGVLLAGGLGVAPMVLAARALRKAGKNIMAILGARNGGSIVDANLENVHLATDDGSRGFHGNVVDLARKLLDGPRSSGAKVFACGPTPMLRAVAAFVAEKNIPCEVSLEGPMACGFGICQGCPVELVDDSRKYALMCKDGPVFDVRKIKI